MGWDVVASQVFGPLSALPAAEIEALEPTMCLDAGTGGTIDLQDHEPNRETSKLSKEVSTRRHNRYNRDSKKSKQSNMLCQVARDT